MAVEAPYSKYRKQNCFVVAGICLALTVWTVYDGYFNEKWIEEHTNPDGTPQAYLSANQKAPFVLIPIAVISVGFWFFLRNKKIVADENELVICSTEKIPYDSIEKIDKTHFDRKGHFTITYKDAGGRQTDRKISYKGYDNTEALLAHLVEKIS